MECTKWLESAIEQSEVQNFFLLTNNYLQQNKIKAEVKAKGTRCNKLIKMKNQISDLKGCIKRKDIEYDQVKQEVRKLNKEAKDCKER